MSIIRTGKLTQFPGEQFGYISDEGKVVDSVPGLGIIEIIVGCSP